MEVQDRNITRLNNLKNELGKYQGKTNLCISKTINLSKEYLKKDKRNNTTIEKLNNKIDTLKSYESELIRILNKFSYRLEQEKKDN